MGKRVLKTPFILASILSITGFLFLWMIFFKNDKKNVSQKRKKEAITDKDIKKVQSLIKKVEKENPEMVEKIRKHFAADEQLKKARNSDPEDIGGVVKHWLSDNDD